MSKEEQHKAYIAKIAALNDEVRTNLALHNIVMTSSFGALSMDTQMKAFDAIKTFNDFNEDNDPYGERDFGSVDVDGRKIFFKFDYYDLDMEHGSADPSNPEQTRRIMTVMLASDY